MSSISIDRETFRRLMGRYYQMEAETEAYRLIVSRASIENPALAHEYVKSHRHETERRLEQNEGERTHFEARLSSEDDDAVRVLLRGKFPLH